MAAGRVEVGASLLGGAACAVFAALAATVLPGRLDMLAAAILGGCMAAVAIEDLRRLRLPDAVLYAAAALGLAASALDTPLVGLEPLSAIGWSALSLVLCAGAFYALREGYHRLRGIDGLGLGDVKLAGVGGAWIGWQGFATAVTIAALAALCFVAVRVVIRGPWPAARKIPLALFLAPAIWGVWYAMRLEGLAFP